MRVLNFGAAKEFTDRVPLDALNERYGMTVGNITARIRSEPRLKAALIEARQAHKDVEKESPLEPYWFQRASLTRTGSNPSTLRLEVTCSIQLSYGAEQRKNSVPSPRHVQGYVSAGGAASHIRRPSPVAGNHCAAVGAASVGSDAVGQYRVPVAHDQARPARRAECGVRSSSA